MKKENKNWAYHFLPDQCNNIFVCADPKMFDEQIKHGMIPIHDDRDRHENGVPCFIGYMPNADRLSLDKLVENLKPRQDEALAVDRHNHELIQDPNQGLGIDQGWCLY